ncbi:MAG: O-Antigen ligase [Firmicutes bacterium ADurb.BinA052]|jgi:hypothetical protein|nr:hypothetical protein [Planctomycetota bacterium]OPZ51544.1 MAG: O-Antigen ligase [Firmicutes bacterium ADurb.BinA052]HOE31441.1 O-antigen ligase family protein [Planctomycetota bacterium]HPY71496.1 O-antigen ligase family protein [Planctomycetota bacterium]HQC03771.1 O-antigen ligase family protein [Planctomycetota bacterium]
MLPSAESIQIILPIVTFACLLATFKRPVYGAIAYFIILNARLGDMYPALGAMRFELWAALFVLARVFFAQEGLTRALPDRSPVNKAFWILFLVGMLSVPQAVSVSESWEAGGYDLLKLALFYVMIVCSLRDRHDVELFVWAFILNTTWMAYDTISSHMQGTTTEHGYGAVATARFGDGAGHVALANILNQGIPLTFFWASAARGKWKRLILWLCFFAMVTGIVLSRSRGGFLGIVLMTVAVIYCARNRAKVALGFAIILILLLPFAGRQYMDHMSTISHGIHGSRSSSDRYLGLVNGISMMMKRPVLGVGIGCFARARSIYFGYYFCSHNLYGELLGELGMGSVAWFYFVYIMFREGQRLKKRLAASGSSMTQYINLVRGLQVGLVMRLFLGNFSHCAFIWFWFVTAALLAGLGGIGLRHSVQKGIKL